MSLAYLSLLGSLLYTRTPFPGVFLPVFHTFSEDSPTSFLFEPDTPLLSLFMATTQSLPIFSDSSKLDGANFPIWKMKVISILRSFGHHDFVVNFTERPALGSVAVTQADIDAWDVENNRTHPFLILNCHDSVLSHLRAVDTAPKVWRVLTTLYEMKTPGRIITLETQLLQLTC